MTDSRAEQAASTRLMDAVVKEAKLAEQLRELDLGGAGFHAVLIQLYAAQDETRAAHAQLVDLGALPPQEQERGI